MSNWVSELGTADDRSYNGWRLIPQVWMSVTIISRGTTRYGELLAFLTLRTYFEITLKFTIPNFYENPKYTNTKHANSKIQNPEIHNPKFENPKSENQKHEHQKSENPKSENT